MSLVILAVTGGPCGGKTETMQEMQRLFGGQILVAPEVASILFKNGFPRPGKDVAHSAEWTDDFQHSVVAVQTGMENQYRAMAMQNITRVLLCDRGLLDGAAYLGQGLEAFLNLFGLNLSEVHERYDQVIHLESVAVSSTALYEELKSTNPARYEDAQAAVSNDLALRKVWQDHPNWTLIPSDGGINEVKRQVAAVISSHLTKEIEVKYRLPYMPPPALLGRQAKIIQGYLPLETEVRVRRMTSDASTMYYLTGKDEGTVERPECERSIDAWFFEQLYATTFGERIEKTRHFIPYAGHTLEVDLYGGHLTGLITLECELATAEEVETFSLPDWAKGAVNVTEDSRYKNRNLAKGHIPNW